MDRWHNLDIDLIPVVRPLGCSVSEQRLNCAHFTWVLHTSDELSVSEEFLGADLTGQVVGLS